MATLTLSPLEDSGLKKPGIIVTTALETPPGAPPERTKVPATASACSPIPSNFKPKCHPRFNEVSREVDGYFWQHWDIKDDKARREFLDAGYSRMACLCFPESLDDRIHFACRMMAAFLLIDGEHPKCLALTFLKAGRSSRGYVVRGRLRI